MFFNAFNIFFPECVLRQTLGTMSDFKCGEDVRKERKKEYKGFWGWNIWISLLKHEFNEWLTLKEWWDSFILDCAINFSISYSLILCYGYIARITMWNQSEVNLLVF